MLYAIDSYNVIFLAYPYLATSLLQSMMENARNISLGVVIHSNHPMARIPSSGMKVCHVYKFESIIVT